MPNPKVHWQYCVHYFYLFSFNLNGWILKIICLTPEVYKCAWMSTHITWLASYFCKLTLHATGKPWNKAKIVGSLCCQCMENWTQKTWFTDKNLLFAKDHPCLFIGQAWNNQEFWVHYNVACPLWKCNCVLVWACELASCQVALIAKAALENNKFHSPIFTNF